MIRALARTAFTALAATAALVAGSQSAGAWTGDAYPDGYLQRVNGTGTASGTVKADPAGNVELTGNGAANAEVWAQAAAGYDGAGHTLIAGSAAAEVTQDGARVLRFTFTATQDSPLSVQAGIQVLTSANGAGNTATAELSGAVSNVQVVEVD